MPITPRFAISQSNSHVLIDVRVPHVRVTTESIQVSLTSDEIASVPSEEQQPTTLHFSSPPYLLVLNFHPYRFHETANESCATYVPAIENGMIQLSLRKHTPGVEWENLDLVGRLVQSKYTPFTDGGGAAKTASTSKWLKEVTAGEEAGDSLMGETEPRSLLQLNETTGYYGFLRMFSRIFTDLHRDGLAREMLELPWEEKQNVLVEEVDLNSVFVQRRQQRWNLEQDKLNPERYLQDLEIQDDYVYQCAMAMKPHWKSENTVEDDDNLLARDMAALTVDGSKLGSINEYKKDASAVLATNVYFTSDEQLQMHSIPYPLLPEDITESHQMDGLLLGLWDILFAYVYDHLTTDGDSTVESAWTISTLSTLLSCLEDYSDMVSDGNFQKGLNLAVISSFRRSLIYPYLRNMTFSKHCAAQVVSILQQGPRCVIRCLLQARTILEESELYYLGNKLFLNPYLAWLQRYATQIEPQLESLSKALQQCFPQHQSLLDLNLQCDEDEDGAEEEEDSSGDSSSDEGSSNDSIQSNEARREQANNHQVPVSSALLDDNLEAAPTRFAQISALGPASGGPGCRPLIEEVDS